MTRVLIYHNGGVDIPGRLQQITPHTSNISNSYFLYQCLRVHKVYQLAKEENKTAGFPSVLNY